MKDVVLKWHHFILCAHDDMTIPMFFMAGFTWRNLNVGQNWKFTNFRRLWDGNNDNIFAKHKKYMYVPPVPNIVETSINADSTINF